MSTFSQSIQQEPDVEDVHPAPCWFPYYRDCTCRSEPPTASTTDSEAGAR